MATVTGLTAARMLAIEAASVVGGTVDGSGHLILTKHDGSTIDAGSVIGPTGPSGGAYTICTSGTRPGSPSDGLAIYETDTKLVRTWNGTRWRTQERIIATSTTHPTTLLSTDIGVKLYETDTGAEYIWNGTAWVSAFDMTNPIGSEMIWNGNIADIPPLYMHEDGRLLLRADYPTLFAKIGTRWNTGGELGTQFRIPDSRDKVAVGAGSTYAAGAYGGANTHTLTTSQMPVHSHTVNDSGHAHDIPDHSVGVAAGEWSIYVLSGGDVFAGGATPHTTGITIANAGGTAGVTQPHNNMQSFAAKYVCIRVL